MFFNEDEGDSWRLLLHIRIFLRGVCPSKECDSYHLYSGSTSAWKSKMCRGTGETRRVEVERVNLQLLIHCVTVNID